jgi:ATF/CREB family transcription factor
MLAGPAGQTDYFDGLARGSFPTPNESSLRTGLTPGGGGSMFPAPSPNSQAIFNQLQSGGATPSTLDFHRTAMNAAALRKNEQYQNTSNPQPDLNQVANMDPKLQQQGPNDPFAQHDATDAANGLYLLAQARDGTQPNNQYAMPQQPIQSKIPNQMGQPQEGSSNVAKRGGRNVSMGGSISSTHEASGGLSDTPSEQSKPNTRGKGKKGGAKGATTNGRRKADETTQKASNKRAKGNNGQSNVDPSLEEADSDDDDDAREDPDSNKKMTDEEKRKNFLERNRYVKD